MATSSAIYWRKSQFPARGRACGYIRRQADHARGRPREPQRLIW